MPPADAVPANVEGAVDLALGPQAKTMFQDGNLRRLERHGGGWALDSTANLLGRFGDASSATTEWRASNRKSLNQLRESVLSVFRELHGAGARAGVTDQATSAYRDKAAPEEATAAAAGTRATRATASVGGTVSGAYISGADEGCDVTVALDVIDTLLGPNADGGTLKTTNSAVEMTVGGADFDLMRSEGSPGMIMGLASYHTKTTADGKLSLVSLDVVKIVRDADASQPVVEGLTMFRGGLPHYDVLIASTSPLGKALASKYGAGLPDDDANALKCLRRQEESQVVKPPTNEELEAMFEPGALRSSWQLRG